MINKKIIIHFTLCIVFLSSSLTFSREEYSYQSAKVIKIEERRPGQNLDHTGPSRERSYQDTSRVEQNYRNSAAMGTVIQSAFSSSTFYLITLQLKENRMIVKYDPKWSWGREPDLVENEQVEFRFDAKKKNAFIKQKGEKEMRTEVVLRNLS